LLTLFDGKLCGAYLISNAPEFREKEITRIWFSQLSKFIPRLALLLYFSRDCDWLFGFFKDKGIELKVIDDFRENLVKKWISEQ